MTRFSHPSAVPLLLERARLADPTGAEGLLAEVERHAPHAPSMRDDVAMALLAGAGSGDADLVAGIGAWVRTAIRDTGVRDRLWHAHRGVILFLLEAAAQRPSAWCLPAADAVVLRILELALREERVSEARPGGVSFDIVEGFANDVARRLRAAPNAEQVLVAARDELKGIEELPWPEVRRRSATRGGLLRTSGGAPSLGVPFESACPPPWVPGVTALARRFLTAARADVSLYDRAPLAVALSAIALPGRRSPSTAQDLMRAADGGWDAVTTWALEGAVLHAGEGKP